MRFVTFPSTRSEFALRLKEAPYNLDELSAFLNLRLKIAERASERSKSLLGRIYNTLAGESPEYSQLTGREIQVVAHVIGAEVSDLDDAHALFELRVDVIQDVFLKLQQLEKHCD